MQTAVHDLLRKDNAAGQVMAHASQLLRLNGLLQQFVPAPMGAAVRVANIKAGKIVILAENGAVAVKIRQMSGRLQDAFSAAKVECSGIEVKVQPRERHPESKASLFRPLSAGAAGSLQRLADGLPAGSALQNALQHLLNRAARSEPAHSPTDQEQT